MPNERGAARTSLQLRVVPDGLPLNNADNADNAEAGRWRGMEAVVQKMQGSAVRDVRRPAPQRPWPAR